MKASRSNHNLYNKKLRERAHALRYPMTKAEVCLWKYALSKGQMKGYVFNRQRPVLNYIADFMSKELQLIIEVDGGYHLNDGMPERDKKRQSELEAAGFTVIRFTNDEVLKRMGSVIEDIEKAVKGLERKRA